MRPILSCIRHAMVLFTVAVIVICLFSSEPAPLPYVLKSPFNFVTVIGVEAGDSLVVTYGSAITLQHQDTDSYLFSAKISWGSGSGQQAVTADPNAELDASTLWIVREGSGDEASSAGDPVACDDLIRLEHATSNKNLHSHQVYSPISKNYEVCAYGEDGLGNSDDYFQVLCDTKVWRLHQKARFRHIGTNGYLSASSGKSFSRENCPRCPIQGHMEVVVTRDNSAKTSSGLWKAGEGLMLSHELGHPETPPKSSVGGSDEISSESSSSNEEL